MRGVIESKPLWKSKSFWLAVITGLTGVLQESYHILGEGSSAAGSLLIALSLLQIAARLVTDQAVHLFGLSAVCLMIAGTAQAGDNFVCADKRFEECAEYHRARQAVYWTGRRLPAWSKPFEITSTHAEHSGGGTTTFTFEDGEVIGWRMKVEGRDEVIVDDVIPHEVAHTVLASIVRRPIPRWLDEGIATLFEGESSHRRVRETAMYYLNHPARAWKRLDASEYPSDGESWAALYSTGYTTVEWMMARGGKDQLLSFVKDKRPPSEKFHDYYGLTPRQAEQKWRSWMHGRSTGCEDCCMQRTAKPVREATASSDKPILWIIGSDYCGPCLKVLKDIRCDSQFRRRLADRFRVIKVDIDRYKQWAAGKGVISTPAFLTSIDPELIVGYRGKDALIAELDLILSRRCKKKTDMDDASVDDAPPPPPDDDSSAPPPPHIEQQLESLNATVVRIVEQVERQQTVIEKLVEQKPVIGPAGPPGPRGERGPTGPSGESSDTEQISAEIAALKQETRQLRRRLSSISGQLRIRVAPSVKP